MSSPDADFDALMVEMGQLQTEIDAADGWDLDSRLSQAMDALQCPIRTPQWHIFRWRASPCGAVRLLLEAPDLLLLMSQRIIWTQSPCSG